MSVFKSLDLFLLSLAFGSLALCETHPIPPINDQAILKSMSGADYTLPERIYTDAFLEGVKAEKFGNLLPGYADRNRAKKWLTIPESKWAELISDFAPVSTKGTNISYGGRCPFTGKNFYSGTTMSDDEFLATPFQARTADGGHVIYGREEDMPDDYKWRPNHTIEVPHLDGTSRKYRFFVPKGTEDAPEKFRSDRRHWLCPAGEVWLARLRIIMRKVLADLGASVFLDNNDQAARSLAAILDRFADVYPGLPLYSQAISHGFARSRDGSSYLTRPEYLAAVKTGPFRNWENKPYWFHS
ncbi:MAG: hypothetical protein QF886_10705, partial [Planctomycetota bacterium]|nr:hypothetical protein [Planctomycetota bacterium]